MEQFISDVAKMREAQKHSKIQRLITALEKIEQMSDCGSYANAIINMKAIATNALKDFRSLKTN